ncbi:LuxR C-terminal-related transcriptional regulator [Herbiconiux daphne]|uniref:LuxR C-terminal-related transcriptional regulator n=1 Tax=Herbiconiux daphne TaxID=2970914 RepID=UPI0028774146|nr:LuxR C-terminal-related transcriptional regulator [Herbiconiux daphne]
MEFIAHRGELDFIAQIATAPAESAVVFVGEPGIGKSHLLAAALAEAQVQAVLLHANPAEAAWPLSGFSRIFASIGDSRAVEFGGRFTLRSTDPQFMFAAARDLLSLLRGLSLPPLLVLVDDLDKMDPETQTLIGFMAGRLAGTGLRFVATAERIGDDSPLAGFQQREVHRLTVNEAVELALAELGPGTDVGTLQIVAGQADGNPLVMMEAANSLSHEQVAGREPLVLPSRPTEAIKAAAAQRLAGIADAQLAMLETIALAPVSQISALTRQSTDDIDALEDVLYSGLAIAHGQYVRLVEPLLRSSLYWGMKPRDRRLRHSELAESNTGVDDRLRAWHASFAGPDAALTDDLLVAATGFAEEGDIAAAVELAERALLIAVDLEAHHVLVFRFASALRSQAELELAERYLLHVRFDKTSAALNMALASERIVIEFEKSQIVPSGDVDAAVSLYGDDDPSGAVRLLSSVTSFHAGRWEVDEGRRSWGLAGKFTDRASAEAVAASHEALSMLDAVDSRPVDEPPATRISSESLQARSPSSLISFATMLTYRERYAQARRVYAVLFSKPDLEPLAEEWARSMACTNELRAGDFHRARLAVEDWLSVSLPVTSHRSVRSLLLAWYSYSKERLDEARAHSAECLALASEERNQAVLARIFTYQGQASLLEGDPEEAVRVLLLADATAAHISNPSLLRHAADLVEACVLTGRMREAESVLRRMLEQQQQRPTRWLSLAVGRARAMVAPDDLAPTLFREAVSSYDGHDHSFDHGRTLLAQADRLAKLGHAQAAEHAASAATAAFENAGATLWARRYVAQAEPAPAVPASAVLALLTPEEREVAEMVRKGFRNREIAAELYISLRTVELRLTHIYRKVGARSRSHLASLLN